MDTPIGGRTVARTLRSEAETEALGARLAALLVPGTIVFLYGDLGTGKTTLVRGLLRALGVTGIVKSPTYTLVEPYRTADLVIHHFDLYRLRDPYELEEMGIRDYLQGGAICLVEWPARGHPVLRDCDLAVTLSVGGSPTERVAHLQARSAHGIALVDAL
ncbi:MAG: tRNA threonylcarbamoyladenosine biosynthesis protein TsaE [Gammaproteobacteria bacterium]|nr:tRNA threonylcarbamoyladenosine biosynthesis protein TsaE [Gammaproteobacteria bacterium]